MSVQLSIVVPVYNVEQYIYRCIDSLVTQNVERDEYEIIVVDDGSKDKSADIIKQNFSQSNIKIVTKENGGLSSARNRGLELAKGDYVWFVDSDDWIEKNSLYELFSVFSNKPDVIALTRLYQEEKFGTTLRIVDESVKTGLQMIATKRFTGAPSFIYKREFLIDKSLLFHEGILHEDVEFGPRMLYLCKRLCIYKIPLYHYFIRDGSITSQASNKRCLDMIFVINSLLDFCRKCVLDGDQKKFSNSITDAVLCLLELSMSVDLTMKKNIKKYIKSHPEFKQFFTYNRRFPTRLLGTLSLISHLSIYELYHNFYRIHKFFKK